MKLIMAIMHNDDTQDTIAELNKCGYHSTKVASTGGFLSSGNTTLIIGVEDEKANDVIRIISENGKVRSQYVPTNIYPSLEVGGTIKVQTGGATIFVINIEQFIQV
ncbi:MAG: cyclic-di-AMP receptor [Clostridia bacterium]|nr:cyclic-di-AMP receptor [Clostridia bacterium]